MSRRMLVKVTGPTVVIGALLLAACLASAWYITQMQTNMPNILKDHVTSLRAAEQLEVSAAQLRFDCLLSLLDPAEEGEKDIQADEKRFEDWLAEAKRFAYTEPEKRFVAE